LILFASMEMSAKAGTLSPTIPVGQLTGGGNVTSPEESGAALAPMSDGEKQGFGCLISGSLSLGATLLANPNEMIMVIAGGTLAPTTTIGVGVAILGTVFASICAVGAIATPAILWTWNHYSVPWTWSEEAGGVVEGVREQQH
jgi:hypothetical protein